MLAILAGVLLVSFELRQAREISLAQTGTEGNAKQKPIELL